MPESGPPLPESELILRSLLPTSLKAPTMNFIEETDIENEEDLTSQAQNISKDEKLRGPLTAFQQERKQLKIIEEKEAKKEEITDEERDRTIKCLMKCMEYQLEGVTQQTKEMEELCKRQDKDMEAYKREVQE